MKNTERFYQTIIAPHMSEKASVLAEDGVYVFEVMRDATKADIKKAVEFLFKTKVASVGVLNIKGKAKRFGQREGRRSGWKKAYVTLQDGLSLEFAGNSK